MFRWSKLTPATSKKRQRGQYQAKLEGLETRQCLSTTVSLSGNTLNIIGDSGTNRVSVFFRDSVNDIHVKVDGVDQHFKSMQVQNLNVDLQGGDDVLLMQLGEDSDASAYMFDPKNISVDLGDGADTAEFWFGGLPLPNRAISTNLNINVNAGSGDDDVVANFGEMQPGSLNFNASLGAGNDTGFAGVWGNVDSGASLKLNLQGEDGDDNLNTYETYNGAYDNVNIAPNALLDINVGGGAGNDHMNMTYGGRVLGKLQIRQDGGDGNDAISGDVHLQALSSGAVDAVFAGGNGSDVLGFELYGQSSALRALIDGGSGLDHAHSVGNVQTINANELVVVAGPIKTIGTFRQA